MDNIFIYGFSIFSVGMGILLLSSTAIFYFHGRHMEKWHVTRGKVIKSQVGRGGMAYVPTIHFQYQVDGIEYIGSSININGKQSFKQKVAQGWIAPYPLGKEVDVYYNPLKPRMAVLEKNISIGPLITVSGVGLILVAMGILNFFD
jgi:hypothetical protein